MKRLLFILLLLPATITNAQTTRWAYDIGDSSDITESTVLCTDYNSNVYMAASYRTKLSMCAATLPNVIPPYGAGANINQVIAKYDSAGNCKWVVTGIDLSTFQSNGNELTAIKYDGNNFSGGGYSSIGNIYVAGQATDTVVYGTDTIHNSVCRWGLCIIGYILKLDTNGNVQWTRTINGSMNASPSIAAMEVINGNIYVAGWYQDTVSIDTCVLPSYNAWTFRGYIAKINSTGRCEWLKNVADSGLINSMDAMTTDGKDLYVLGSISGMAVFGSDTVLSSGTNSFVSKYDTNGNFKWIYGAPQLGGYLYYDQLRYDYAGHIYISGIYNSSIRFSTSTITTADTASVCAVRLDTAGNFNWLYGTGLKAGYLGSTTIAADDSGFYLYTNFKDTAYVGGSTYIDPGGGMSGQFLMARYDTNRSVVWSKSYGGLRENWVADITAYEGSVYYTAVTYNSFTLDGFPIVNHGYADVLLARMAVPYNPGPPPLTGLDTLCVGVTSTLSDATTGGVWSSSNTAIALIGSSTGIVTGLSVGVVVVTYTVGTGNATKTITINPSLSSIVETQHVFYCAPGYLIDSSTGGVWSSSNTIVATIGSATGIVTADSFYYAFVDTTTITYLVSAGCYVTMLDTVFPCPAGVPMITSINGHIGIFPNPASTSLTIIAPSLITSITISNLLGQVMYSNQYNSPQVEVGVADLPVGIYFVKINGTDTRKFVKQ